jgi:hypothetical protein
MQFFLASKSRKSMTHKELRKTGCHYLSFLTRFFSKTVKKMGLSGGQNAPSFALWTRYGRRLCFRALDHIRFSKSSPPAPHRANQNTLQISYRRRKKNPRKMPPSGNIRPSRDLWLKNLF